jgi:glycosyltransferase involved in cell wall biosynthesis
MAYGMPIVSTTKGAEGLNVQDGEHLLLADSPLAFANAVQRLLADPAESARLGARARELVRQAYCWDAIGDRLRAIVVETLRAHQAGELGQDLLFVRAPVHNEPLKDVGG